MGIFHNGFESKTSPDLGGRPHWLCLFGHRPAIVFSVGTLVGAASREAPRGSTGGQTFYTGLPVLGGTCDGEGQPSHAPAIPSQSAKTTFKWTFKKPWLPTRGPGCQRSPELHFAAAVLSVASRGVPRLVRPGAALPLQRE